LSLPVPPLISSFPTLASTKSLPPSAEIWSAWLVPWSTSAPFVPVMTAAADTRGER
jgi:hypothetical protein